MWPDAPAEGVLACITLCRTIGGGGGGGGGVAACPRPAYVQQHRSRQHKAVGHCAGSISAMVLSGGVVTLV